MVTEFKTQPKFIPPAKPAPDSLFFGFGPVMTDEQRGYVDSLFTNQITFVDAKSGTGKTTLAVAAAKLMDRPLYYVFAPVQENKMGFRPGGQKTKEIEYHGPLVDALKEIDEMPEQAIWDEDEFRPHAWVYPMSHIFARGTNIQNATVIIDEAQNFTRGELKKLLTRIHDSCTVIVIGNEAQCDLSNPSKSGFVPYLKHFESQSYVGVCKLTHNFRGRLAQYADELEW